MTDSTAPATPGPAPTKATKAKAPKSPKAAKAAPSHPTYSIMIKKALVDLKERNGSSRTAISKYLTSHYKLGDSSNQINARLRAALKKGLVKGELEQTKGNGASGSFKLVKATPAAPSAKKAPAAKKPATKKTAAKKEKKTASPKKTKAAPKPKTKKPKSPKKVKKTATKPKTPKAKKTTVKA